MAKKRWRGRRKVMNRNDAITKALSGSRRKERTWKHDLDDLVKAHGAEGARERLGVSKSTWRAWNAGKRGPNRRNRSNIEREWNTPAVRRHVIPKRRATKAQSNGMRISVTGVIGPRKPAAGQDYTTIIDSTDGPRYRSIGHASPIELSDHAVESIMDIYVYEGPDAAMDELEHVLAVEYFGRDPSDEDVRACLEDITDIGFYPGDSPAGGGYFESFDR